MDSNILKAISATVNVLVTTNAKTATKYLSPKLTLRASQITFKGKLQKGNVEIRLTIGKPNYSARKFIKKCLKVNEPFPVKKVQLRFPSKGK